MEQFQNSSYQKGRRERKGIEEEFMHSWGVSTVPINFFLKNLNKERLGGSVG